MAHFPPPWKTFQLEPVRIDEVNHHPPLEQIEEKIKERRYTDCSSLTIKVKEHLEINKKCKKQKVQLKRLQKNLHAFEFEIQSLKTVVKKRNDTHQKDQQSLNAKNCKIKTLEGSLGEERKKYETVVKINKSLNEQSGKLIELESQVKFYKQKLSGVKVDVSKLTGFLSGIQTRIGEDRVVVVPDN